MTVLQQRARDNLQALRENSYPGRGIVLGRDQIGHFLVQIYWIMGRSKDSRNRVLTYEKDRLFTEAADPTTMQDPSLIIYEAMNECNGDHIVSNGHQTKTVAQVCADGDDGIEWGLRSWKYEPDAPNYTPRITGISSLRDGRPASAALSILRKSPWNDSCERHLYRYPTLEPGFGHCITTYKGDGDPLPSFTGEPFLVPIEGNIDEVADRFWNALDSSNRVALAVKFADANGSIIEIRNQRQKVV